MRDPSLPRTCGLSSRSESSVRKISRFEGPSGVEQKIGSQSYVKAEYRYSNYKEIEDFDIDADRHQIMAGVGIRF